MARRSPVYRLALVIGVLLAHGVVLIGMQKLLRQPAPADRSPPPPLLYRVVPPALPPQTEPLAETVRSASVQTPVTQPARRLRVAPAPPTATTATPPVPLDAGNGPSAAIAPPSGHGSHGNQLDLTLSPRFNSSPSTAHQVQRQWEQNGSSSAAKIDGGSVTVTERQSSDGSTIARITTLSGTCVQVQVPGADRPFMSDLPAHRTALPQRCR
jgi:hypothetical protein